MKTTVRMLLILFAMLLTSEQLCADDYHVYRTYKDADGNVCVNKYLKKFDGTQLYYTKADNYRGVYYVDGNYSLGNLSVQQGDTVALVLAPNSTLNVNELKIFSEVGKSRTILKIFRQCNDDGTECEGKEGHITINALKTFKYGRNCTGPQSESAPDPEFQVYAGVIYVGAYTYNLVDYPQYRNVVRTKLGSKTIWSSQTSFSCPNQLSSDYLNTSRFINDSGYAGVVVGDNKVWGALPPAQLQYCKTGLLGTTGPSFIDNIMVGSNVKKVGDMTAPSYYEVAPETTDIIFTFNSPYIANRATLKYKESSEEEWTTATLVPDESNARKCKISDFIIETGKTYQFSITDYATHEFSLDYSALTSTNSSENRYVENWTGAAIYPSVALVDQLQPANTNISDNFTITNASATNKGTYDMTFAPKAGSPYYGNGAKTFYWAIKQSTDYTIGKGDYIFGGSASVSSSSDPDLMNIISTYSPVSYEAEAADCNKLTITFREGYSPRAATWQFEENGNEVVPVEIVYNDNTRSVTFTFNNSDVQFKKITATLTAYKNHPVTLETTEYAKDDQGHAIRFVKAYDNMIGIAVAQGHEAVKNWLTENFTCDNLDEASKSDAGKYLCGTYIGKAGTKYNGIVVKAYLSIYDQSVDRGSVGWLALPNPPASYSPSSLQTYAIGSETKQASDFAFGTQDTFDDSHKYFIVQMSGEGSEDTYWNETAGTGSFMMRVNALQGLKITKLILCRPGDYQNNDFTTQATGISVFAGAMDVTNTTAYVSSDYMLKNYTATVSPIYQRDAVELVYDGAPAEVVTFNIPNGFMPIHKLYIEYEKYDISTLTYNLLGNQGGTATSEVNAFRTFNYNGTKHFPLKADNPIHDANRDHDLKQGVDFQYKNGEISGTISTTESQRIVGRYSTKVAACAQSIFYYGNYTIVWSILQSIDHPDITFEVQPVYFTGAAINDDDVVKGIHVYDKSDTDEKTELIQGTHYTVSFRAGHTEFKNAGTYVDEVILTGNPDYGLTGTRTIDVTILPMEVMLEAVAAVEYTGTPITTIPTGAENDAIRVRVQTGKDAQGQPTWEVITANYTITIPSESVCQEAGFYHNALDVTLTDPNYTCTGKGDLIIWKSFDATKPYAADFVMSEVPTQFIDDPNSSDPVEPAFTLKDNGKNMTLNADYKVDYSNNIGIGVATITVNEPKSLSAEFDPAKDVDTRIYRGSREITFYIGLHEFLAEDGITYVTTSPTTIAVKNASPISRLVVPATVTYTIKAAEGTPGDPGYKAPVTLTFDVTGLCAGSLGYEDLTSVVLPSSIKSIEGGAFKGSTNVRWIDLSTAADFTPVLLERDILEAPFYGVPQPTLVFLNGLAVKGVNYIYNLGSGFLCDELRIYDDLSGSQTDYTGSKYDWGFENPYEFTANTILNTRKLNSRTDAGVQQGYTLCLPYALPVDNSIFKAYTLLASKDNVIGFEPVTGTLAALTPYVMIPKTNGMLLSATNAVVKNTLNWTAADDPTSYADAELASVTSTASNGQQTYVLKASLRYMDGAEAEGAYIMQGGNVWKKIPASSAYPASCILPMRAYITAVGFNPSRLMSVFSENSTTDLGGFNNIVFDAEDGQVFDLQGRAVSTPVHGVYIRNGKKIVVR